MLQLLDFQEEAAEWLLTRNTLLADDCGLGKTVITVEAIKRYGEGPILVVCPRLSKEWWAQTITEQEAGKSLICKRAGKGVPWDKLSSLSSRPLRWVIVHPEALRISEHLISRINWGTIVVDEAHRFKNRKAKQTKSLKKLRANRRIMLTATPYSEDPSDVWSLLNFLEPKKFTSFWRFHNTYVSVVKKGGYVVHKEAKNLKALARVLSPLMKRRTKKDVLGLEDPFYTNAPVFMMPEQAALYNKLAKEAYAELYGQEIILENGLVRLLRLQQAAADPMLISEEFPTLLGRELPAKVQWIYNWLEDNPDEPVVITSRYRKFVEKWLRPLTDNCIVGGMKSSEVEAIKERFTSAKRPFLVGSLDAIKESMNLQAATTMIIVDGTYSSTADYQLKSRIHRMGTKEICNIIYLIAKTDKMWSVDKVIREAVVNKLTTTELLDRFVRSLQY